MAVNFEDVKIESIDTISDILSHFHSTKDSIQDEDELRVFKVMLLSPLCGDRLVVNLYCLNQGYQ